MKKLSSILTVLALICTQTACSKGRSESIQPFTAEKLSDAAYRQEKIDLPENAGIIYGAVPFGGGENVYLLGSAETSPAFWKSDRDLSKFERIELPDFDIGTTYNFAVSNDGELADIVIHADYGSLPSPDPGSPDYNEDKYDAAAEYSLRIIVYTPDGKVRSDCTVENYREVVDKRTMLGDTAYDGQHIIVNIGGEFEAFSVDGKYLGELAADDGESICDICTDSTGALKAAVEIENGTFELRSVNAEDCTLDGGDRYILGESIQQLTSGSGGYSLFIRTRSTIYGVSDGKTIEPLFDINATNLNVNNIIGSFLGSDGNIIVCTTDFSKWQSKLTHFIHCDPSELGDIRKLRIGVESEYSLQQEVDLFTEENPDIQIERIIYENKSDDPFKPEFTQFNEDILSGNLPDILWVQPNGTFCQIDVAEKGALIDLMPYMKKSDIVKPEDIFPNVLESVTTDGKVFALPYRFCADLGYVCKKKWADKLIQGEFSFNTYMDAIENRPAGMKVFDWMEQDTKWQRSVVANDTWWINPDSMTCDFTSDSFIRYLRYCEGGKEEEQSDSIYADPMNPTEAEIRETGIAQQMQYRNDVTLFKRFSLGNFDNYMSEVKGLFGGEELAYLGLPREDGAHTYVDFRLDLFGITRDSKMPDEAWKFISFMESYDFENNGWTLGGFPITENGFYKLADKMKFDDKPRWSDQKDNGYFWGDGENTLCIGPLTDNDIEFIHNKLVSAEVPPKAVNIRDQAFYNILDEERNALFAGESTPEQCAKYMQDRIGTFLSERY